MRIRRNIVLWVTCWLASASVASTRPTTPEPGSLPDTIPIFPLQDVMLFPQGFRPLHIFEPRYREMVLHALVSDRIIGMVMLQPGHEEDYYGRPPIYPVGCAGVIENVEELPDGRYNIVLRGLTKFRVTDEDTSLAFRMADVEAIREELNDDEQEALRAHRPKLVAMLSELAPAGTEPTPEEMPDEELVNGLAQFLPMAPQERLKLLELHGTLARAEALLAIARKQRTRARNSRLTDGMLSADSATRHEISSTCRLAPFVETFG